MTDIEFLTAFRFCKLVWIIGKNRMVYLDRWTMIDKFLYQSTSNTKMHRFRNLYKSVFAICLCLNIYGLYSTSSYKRLGTFLCMVVVVPRLRIDKSCIALCAKLAERFTVQHCSE